ncbi:MAG: hypothetical protein ACJASW_001211 [Polaribacter sp.]|jgi:hypothetical protein
MTGVSPAERRRISLTAIGEFLLVVLFVVSLPVLFIWTLWLFWAVLAAALVVGLLVRGLALLLMGTERRGHTLATLIVTFSLLTIAVAFPIYYLIYKVEADPPLLPNVVLTNGEKTVVFQGMVHVGMESFFKSVVYDLESAMQSGYRLYYEGIQSSPGEGDDWYNVNQAGGGDLAEHFKALADACGVTFQMDYFSLMEESARRNPGRHVVADVTTLDMKQEYQRLIMNDPEFDERMRRRGKLPTPRPPNLVDRLLDWHGQANDSQRELIGVLCRGFISIALDEDNIRDRDLDKVVLDFRNRKLVERLLADPANKIYITYGAAHLPGVVTLLREQDPDWQILSVKWVRGLATPENWEGSLDIPLLPVQADSGSN